MNTVKFESNYRARINKLQRHIEQLATHIPDQKSFLFDQSIIERLSSRDLIPESIPHHYHDLYIKENLHLCRNMKGVLYELNDRFLSAYRDKLITEGEYLKSTELVADVLKVLNNQIQSLEKKPLNKIRLIHN
jgi:hypothetical protein